MLQSSGFPPGAARHEERGHVRGVPEQDHVRRPDDAAAVQPAADVGLDLRLRGPDLSGSGPDLSDGGDVALCRALGRQRVGRGTQVARRDDQELLAAEPRVDDVQPVTHGSEVHERPVVVDEGVVPGAQQVRAGECALVVATEVDRHVHGREHLQLARLGRVLAAGGAHGTGRDVAHRAERAAVDRRRRELGLRVVGPVVDLERLVGEGRGDRARRGQLQVDRLLLERIQLDAGDRVALDVAHVDVHVRALRNAEEGALHREAGVARVARDVHALHGHLEEVLASDQVRREGRRRQLDPHPEPLLAAGEDRRLRLGHGGCACRRRSASTSASGAAPR